MAATAPSPSSGGNDLSWSTKQMGRVVSGGMAGVLSKTAVAPFDRIKILCQTGASRGVINTAQTVIKADGIPGLWRGNTVNCIRVFPSKGILYMCTDLYKEGFRHGFPQLFDEGGGAVPTYLSFVAGAMSGVTASIVTYPLDLVRARQAGILTETRGIISTLLHVARTEGARGLYAGLAPTALGAIPYEGIKFGIYDLLKSTRPEWLAESSNPQIDTYYNLFCGAAAGTAASVLVFPNDTVRRIMQIQGALPAVAGHAEHKPHKNFVECYVQTYKHSGFKRFYRGLGPTLLRVVPNAAIQFGVYEYGKKLLA